MLLSAFEFRNQGLYGLFGIAKDHAGIVIIKQLIFNAGKTSGHGTLEHKNGLGFVRVDDGHAVYGA